MFLIVYLNRINVLFSDIKFIKIQIRELIWGKIN